MALQCGIMVMPYSNNKRVTKEYKYTIYQYITFICHFLLLLHFPFLTLVSCYFCYSFVTQKQKYFLSLLLYQTRINHEQRSENKRANPYQNQETEQWK